jgi:molecular chaperone DnaK (HSP70)
MTKTASISADTPSARYVVGMDLGTTNSAVAYVDAEGAQGSIARAWQVETLLIPQLTAPSTVEARETLPSFHYQAVPGEFPSGALKLPFNSGLEPDRCVGFLARDHGAAQPGRLIASAKSWLCHTGVDRAAELLPWHGADDVQRLSPVEASARYLTHVRAAWDAAHPRHPLAEQDFVLTLPASFDEVARELTVAAAARAGLPRVVLIEEPQAAFYAWLNLHRENWETLVTPGQTILVCDIGGGTSDLTLIRARSGEDGRVRFHRVAVGEHLILGGDNLDMALAHHVEGRFTPDGQLPPRQWDQLVRHCRRVKETLLGASPPERMTITLAGSGTRLIGGGLQAEVTRDEVRQLLLEGFLPPCAITDAPLARRSGFQEFGLPYATDAAITRYLAAFLSSHRAQLARDSGQSVHDPARPDIVLFNGGFFHSPALRERLLDVLRSWFDGRTENPHGQSDAAWQPVVLEHDRLDLAVARGAAYYGMVLRGEGVRIAADLARTYYLGVDSEQSAKPRGLPPGSIDAGLALCVAPASAEPGQEIVVPRPLGLLVSQPVEFPLYVSSTRLTDAPGEVLPVEREHLKALAPIRTVLQARGKSSDEAVPVQVHSRLSEIGTLELWCAEQGGPRRWKMQFDVRAAVETDRAAHTGAGEQAGVLDEGVIAAAVVEIARTFGIWEGEAPAEPRTSLSTSNVPGAALRSDSGHPVSGSVHDDSSPDTLMQRLAVAAGLARHEWPPSLLRRLWEALVEHEAGRKRSPTHEARWLNLLGYALRPGYGVALDDWRVAETWKLLSGKLAHGAARVQNEWWILCRRIAGGLTSGQQRALAEPLLAPLRAMHKRLMTGKGAGDLSFASQESVEVWRLLGALELLPPATKLELGRMILELLPKKKLVALRPALLWTLGRVAARVPVAGPLNVILGGETAEAWLTALIEQPLEESLLPWTVMQLARKTGDRYRDVRPTMRAGVVAWLSVRQKNTPPDSASAVPEHFIALVRDGGELDQDEQARVFGEALPAGLRIL